MNRKRIAAHLEAALRQLEAESLPRGELFTLREVLDHLREECNLAGSQRNWAQRHGFSDAYVSAVLLGARKPSSNILNALQFKRADLYEAVRFSVTSSDLGAAP